MSLDRNPSERLNEYLDAVVTSDPTRGHDLDPVLAALVEHFFAMDDAPAPPPGLADRVWRDLMRSSATGASVPLVPAGRPDRNGRTPLGPPLTTLPNGREDRPQHGPSAIVYFATAALLVLTLVGGLVAFRGSLPLVSPEPRANILPASDITPQRLLPADVAPEGILLRSRIDQLPSQGGTQQLALYRLHLAPGAEESVGSQADSGVRADQFTVEAGRVTVEADASVLVTRTVANPVAAPSLVEPGNSIVLEAGDQLAVPSGVSFRRRNDGPTSATVLGLSIGTGEDVVDARSLPPGVTYDPSLPAKRLANFPAAPFETKVQRLTLAPGDELAVRDVPGLELLYVEAGSLNLIDDPAATPVPPDQAITIRAGSATESFGPTPERAVLTNRGVEPLVILTASLVSTSTDTPIPEASWSDGWGSGDHAP